VVRRVLRPHRRGLEGLAATDWPRGSATMTWTGSGKIGPRRMAFGLSCSRRIGCPPTAPDEGPAVEGPARHRESRFDAGDCARVKLGATMKYSLRGRGVRTRPPGCARPAQPRETEDRRGLPESLESGESARPAATAHRLRLAFSERKKADDPLIRHPGGSVSLPRPRSGSGRPPGPSPCARGTLVWRAAAAEHVGARSPRPTCSGTSPSRCSSACGPAERPLGSHDNLGR
jgi:hypothetical protein